MSNHILWTSPAVLDNYYNYCNSHHEALNRVEQIVGHVCGCLAMAEG
jgi:hypothetical protein